MSLAPDYFAGTAAHIIAVQNRDGSIPWFKGGVIDPWNHLEAAMGLNIAGATAAAKQAFGFLRDTQLPDGSWWGQLGSAVPIDEATQKFSRQNIAEQMRLRDTNFIAYIATALWHDYCLHADRDYAAAQWPMVAAALDFVIGLQFAAGDIRWTARDTQTPEEDALLTGNASIYKSLICGERLAGALGHDARRFADARQKLGAALADRPERFDRTWGSKRRYAMDWYYPILSGALSPAQEKARLAERWGDFIIDDFGCRCVADEPWVTTAETAELVLTLVAHGETSRAREIVDWLARFRHADGSYWMGLQVETGAFWPDERPAWTAGAVILAYDAVHRLTTAHDVLTAR